MTCEKFNKLIKKTKIIIHEISASSSLVEHKIIIYLFEKFITKDEKWWLENESYLSSEFLQRVKVIESQLQKEYNKYKLNLHSKWYISAKSDKYVELIIKK